MTRLEETLCFFTVFRGPLKKHGRKKGEKRGRRRKRSSSASLKADVRLLDAKAASRNCLDIRKTLAVGSSMLVAAGVFFAQAQNYMDKTIDFLQKCDIMDSQGKHTELKLIQYFICIINNLNFLKKYKFLIFSLKLAISSELNVKNTSLKACPTGFT